MSDVAATETTPPADSQFRHVEVGGEGNLSARAAANALAQNRYKADALDQRDEPIPEAPIDGPIALDKQVSEEEIPVPAEQATGEDEAEATEPQEETPASFELPRSWSKDEADVWAQIPPHAQEIILRRADQGSKTVRQAQNEIAEQRKALETRQTEIDRHVGQLGEITQRAISEFQAAQAGEFADIRTQADIEKMASEDWPRFSKWQARQMGIQQKQQELQQIQQYQQQQHQQQFAKWGEEQNAKFIDRHPDLKDRAVFQKTSQSVIDALTKDIGFDQDKLSKWYTGQGPLYGNDADVQELFFWAAKGVTADKAAKAAKAKVSRPVPNVQRPGSPVHRAADADIVMKNLNSKLNRDGDRKTAVELILAQRAAANRR